MGRYNKGTCKQIKFFLMAICMVVLLGVPFAKEVKAFTRYYEEDGYGWNLQNGKWYYLNENGSKITGWLFDEENNWYLLDTDGAMLTGWQTVGSNTYYFRPDNGTRLTGTQIIDGETYSFSDSGKLISERVTGNQGETEAGGGATDNNAETGDKAQIIMESACVDAETMLPNENVAFYETSGYGWKKEGAVWNYIYKNNIKAANCWVLDEDGTWFFMDKNGALLKGWLDWKGQKYFLNENGAMQIGWMTTENGKYYFRPGNGDMLTGTQVIENQTYDFGQDGRLILNMTGWQTINGDTYFYDSNGKAVTGIVLIDGVQYGFTAEGKLDNSIIPWNVVLVNYKNSIPEGFKISKAYINGYYVDARIAGELKTMIKAAKADGVNLRMTSAYRTIARQEYLYKNALNKYLKSGLSYEDALIQTELYHAYPGKSEHNLGLAIDFIYGSSLNDSFAYSAAGIWLKEHAHEYGFILRYEEDTTDITHIAYEPWHYRFVGVDVAKHIHSAGVCFEEYFPNYTTSVPVVGNTAAEEKNVSAEQDV